MAVTVTELTGSVIETWLDRIVVALHDHGTRPQALTPGEIASLTGLTDAQVSRGCWHGRLHRMLRFHHVAGATRYTLTPLGVAIARRLAAGPVHS